MASHVLPIPEVHRTVTRPLTMDIIREVLDITGLDSSQFRTKMVGYADAETVPGSTIDAGTDTAANRLSSDEKLVMEISEEDVEMNTTPVRYPNTRPIFHDEDLKIMMKPVLSLVKTTISVVITVPSRVRASNWLNEIRRRIHQGKLTNYHTVDYHYPIPKPINYFLMQMHSMRERVEPLNENFGEWVNRCFVNRWTIVSNLSGHERLFAIQEKQTNIYGWFEFEFEPQKADKDSDNAGGWQIQFDYTFHYQRPDSVVFAYPLVIHNQLLPMEFINTERQETRSTYNGYSGLTNTAYDAIAFKQNKYGTFAPPGIPEPLFDDWFPKCELTNYIQLARTLTIVDPGDKRWVLSLDDFSSNYEFKEPVLRYMKRVKNDLLRPYGSVFNVSVHRWDSLIDHTDLTIDDNLKLTSKFDMTLTDMWHVVVSVLADPLMLDEDGWGDVLNDCEAFHEWFSALFGTKYSNAIRCNLDNTVNEDDLNDVLDDIKDQTRPGNNLNVRQGLPLTTEKYRAGYVLIPKQKENKNA